MPLDKIASWRRGQKKYSVLQICSEHVFGQQGFLGQGPFYKIAMQQCANQVLGRHELFHSALHFLEMDLKREGGADMHENTWPEEPLQLGAREIVQNARKSIKNAIS